MRTSRYSHLRLATRILDAPRGRIAIQDLFLGRYVLPFLLWRVWCPEAQEHLGARREEETGEQTAIRRVARERRRGIRGGREAQDDAGETEKGAVERVVAERKGRCPPAAVPPAIPGVPTTIPAVLPAVPTVPTAAPTAPAIHPLS